MFLNILEVKQIWDERVLARSIKEVGREFSISSGGEVKESFASGKQASERERRTQIYGWALGIYTQFAHVTMWRDRACRHAANRKIPLGWAN